MLEFYIDGERKHENLNPTNTSDVIDIISSLVKIYSDSKLCNIRLDITSANDFAEPIKAEIPKKQRKKRRTKAEMEQSRKAEPEEIPKKQRKKRRTKAEMEQSRKAESRANSEIPDIETSQEEFETKLKEHWVKTGYTKPDKKAEKMLEDTKGLRNGSRIVFYDTLRNRVIGNVMKFVYKGDINPLDKNKFLTFSGIIVEAESNKVQYLRKFDEVKKI